MPIETAPCTITVDEVGPVKLLVENGWITGDWSCGKISIYTHQQSRVDCNEESITFLFRLVVFIHFVGMTMFAFLCQHKKWTQQVVTIGYLFRNNTLSTQKMRRITPNNRKGREGQSADCRFFLFALSRSLHSFLKRGHKNTCILVRICRTLHSKRMALRLPTLINSRHTLSQSKCWIVTNPLLVQIHPYLNLS
jgi:hypothetical protein